LSKAFQQDIGRHSFHCSNISCDAVYYVDVVKADLKCKFCKGDGKLCKTVLLACGGSCGSVSYASIPINARPNQTRCIKCGCIERIISDEKKSSEITTSQTSRGPSRPVKKWKPTNRQVKRAQSGVSSRQAQPKASTDNKVSEDLPKGICKSCLKGIPLARLAANPSTDFCLPCANIRPEGQKNRKVIETWGSRDAWKRDRGGWRKGGV